MNQLVPYRPAQLQRRPPPQSETVEVVEVVHRVEVTHYDAEPWPDAWFVKLLAVTLVILIVVAAIVVGFEVGMLAQAVG